MENLILVCKKTLNGQNLAQKSPNNPKIASKFKNNPIFTICFVFWTVSMKRTWIYIPFWVKFKYFVHLLGLLHCMWCLKIWCICQKWHFHVKIFSFFMKTCSETLYNVKTHWLLPLLTIYNPCITHVHIFQPSPPPHPHRYPYPTPSQITNGSNLFCPIDHRTSQYRKRIFPTFPIEVTQREWLKIAKFRWTFREVKGNKTRKPGDDIHEINQWSCE